MYIYVQSDLVIERKKCIDINIDIHLILKIIIIEMNFYVEILIDKQKRMYIKNDINH